MRIQLLDKSHLKAITRLLLTQQTYFGLPIDQFPASLVDVRSMVSLSNDFLAEANPYFRCYGAIDEEDNLLGTVSAEFMFDQPTWVLRRICVPETEKGNSQEVIHALMSEVLAFAEAKGYYQHLYLIPAKYKRAHARIWNTNPDRAGRYTANELELVPANTQPRFRLFWDKLYGRLLFPIDTSVRMSTLLDSAKGEST